jgi:hypothetical protein
MSATEAPLLALVAEHFPDLTEAEKKLLRAVATGDIADCSSPNDAENDPKDGNTWGESRTIRAEIIRWLCVDREATKHIDPNGIRIGAAKINGLLDLQYVTVSVPLVLWQCTVQEGVVLSGAETRLLAFIRSSLGNSSGVALSADDVQVHGGVLLQDGFEAKGEVRLIGAMISGDLDCTGGAFHNAGGIALHAEGIHVNGSVFLEDGFEAEGMVRLLGATIGGYLSCRGGALHNPGEIALFADGVQVHTGLILGDGFQAEGEVRLVGAMIGGDLDCTGGAFHNPGGIALYADKVHVGSYVFLRDGFRAAGIMSLMDANAGPLVDDETSWPEPGTLRVSGFVYTTIAGGPANAKARLRWLERQPPDSFNPQPYQQLARVLPESGREGDAKQVLIAKERVRRKRGNLGWAAWCWNLVLGFSMAHGYKPQRLLLGAMVFVLLGGWLFGAGYQAGTIARAKKAEADVPYPAFNRWIYSLDSLLPIINFGQKEYWRPLDSNPTSAISQQSTPVPFIGVPFTRSLYPMIASWVTSGEFLGAYHWIHIGVGWLLITLGITGVTGLVRKD